MGVSTSANMYGLKVLSDEGEGKLNTIQHSARLRCLQIDWKELSPYMNSACMLSVCLSVRPSVCLIVCLSVCLLVCLSICLFVCLSVLSVCLFVCN